MSVVAADVRRTITPESSMRPRNGTALEDKKNESGSPMPL
jgi:hypothetical protein